MGLRCTWYTRGCSLTCGLAALFLAICCHDQSSHRWMISQCTDSGPRGCQPGPQLIGSAFLPPAKGASLTVGELLPRAASTYLEGPSPELEAWSGDGPGSH